jgi:uncharacterized protein
MIEKKPNDIKTPGNGVESGEWQVIREIEAFARGHLGAMSHGFDHTRRVYNLALVIGTAEKADLRVLLAAALLHDIGRDIEEHIGADHAETSAYFAKDFLKSIDFEPDRIRRVLDAIKQHRFSSPESPNALEAKILSDADKLDAIGAIGVARAFTYGGRHQRDVRGTISHFNEKLLKLKDQMYTETAKKIARERHSYTLEYLQRVQEEIEGIR